MVLMNFIYFCHQELSFKCWENLVITPADLINPAQLTQTMIQVYLWSKQVDLVGGKDDKSFLFGRQVFVSLRFILLVRYF